MKIKIRYNNNIAILDIAGEIDINSSVLIETVGKLLRKGDNKFIINLGEVEFLDYNGLSVLAITYKSILNNNSIIKIANVPGHVMELLCIVKLDTVFSIYTTVNKAIESFEPKGKANKPDEGLVICPLRRRFIRLEMDITVYYKKIEAATDKENALYSGLAGNISGAGLFLRTINILPTGTKVNLDIVIPEPKKSISSKGLVIWIADKQLQPDFFPGMGVKFIEIDQKTQGEILNFIEKNIAK